MEKYTKEGLPIVTTETEMAFMNELYRNIQRKNANSYLTEKLEEIESENPRVLEYILFSTSKFPSNLQVITALSITNLYLLLKSQFNNYKILELFELEE